VTVVSDIDTSSDLLFVGIGVTVVTEKDTSCDIDAELERVASPVTEDDALSESVDELLIE